jgi:putative transposase
LLAGLKSRGLSGVEIVVMPNIAEARAVVMKRLPAAAVASCWIQAIDMSARLSDHGNTAEVRKALTELSFAKSKKDLRTGLKELSTRFGESAAKSFAYIESDLDSLSTYLKFDKDIQRVLRSTNIILRLDRDIRRKALLSGTNEPQLLKNLLSLICVRQEYHWRKFPIDSTQFTGLQWYKARMEID